jgi:Fur family peroxide stress response transcriptional regulator
MQKIELSGCLDPFIELCKKFHLKVTPQRCAIYKNIIKAKTHPTADQMFHIVKKEFPNISYDTVNRTLLTFAEIGLVDVIPTKEGPRRFDPDMENHHHFHCVHCGGIVDFYSDDFDNIRIPNRIQDDFVVYTKTVVLNGVCDKCRKKKGFKNRNSAIQNNKIKN